MRLGALMCRLCLGREVQDVETRRLVFRLCVCGMLIGLVWEVVFVEDELVVFLKEVVPAGAEVCLSR